MCVFVPDPLNAHDPRCYTYCACLWSHYPPPSESAFLNAIEMAGESTDGHLIELGSVILWARCCVVKGAEGRINPHRFKFISVWIIYRTESQWFPVRGGGCDYSSLKRRPVTAYCRSSRYAKSSWDGLQVKQRESMTVFELRPLWGNFAKVLSAKWHIQAACFVPHSIKWWNLMNLPKMLQKKDTDWVPAQAALFWTKCGLSNYFPS